MPFDNDPVALTRTLIEIPSESSGPIRTNIAEAEKAVSLKLQEWFAAAGVSCCLREVLPGRCNFIAHFPRPGAPRLMITGHMDTVSAAGENHAFAPIEENGRIFGRGACDDKGPLAAAVCAMLNGAREKKFDLTFLATVGEEDGMHGAKAYARENAGGDRFDLILALEPTRLAPVTAHKGCLRLRVATSGKSCHSSEPSKGINAIGAMAEVIGRINAFGASLAARRCPRTGTPVLSVTQIHGGSAPNVIPDSCEITVDLRTIPGMSDRDTAASLAEYCGTDARVEIIDFYDSMCADPSGPVWDEFRGALQAASLSPVEESVKYGTDCSFLQALGPCVVWGPGDIAQAHTVSEFIDIAQLRQAVAVLSAWIG